MCMDAPEAPQSDPRLGEAAMSQAETGARMADYAISADKSNRDRLARLDDQQAQIVNDFRNSQKKAEARGDEAYNFYMSSGRPMIERTLQDANNWDSESALSALRAKASADVEQAFSGQRGSAIRAMGRMGVNPGSGRFMATLAGGGADAALAKVNAANTMTENRRTQATGLRQQASNLVSGMPAQSMGFSGAGQAAGASALSGSNMGFTNALGAQQAYNGSMGVANGFGNSAINGFGQINNANMSAYGAQMTASGQEAAGLGTLAGMGLMMFSDRRLKTNIERIGTTPKGLPIYEFDYVWGGPRQVGVMADDVEKVMPQAVITDTSGYKLVNYALVG